MMVGLGVSDDSGDGGRGSMLLDTMGMVVGMRLVVVG